MSQESGDNANKFLPRSLDEAQAWNNKGVALLGLKRPRPRAALRAFRHAIDIAPEFAKAWMNSGEAYTVLRKPALALAMYDHAIALNPDYGEAWLGSAESLAKLK